MKLIVTALLMAGVFLPASALRAAPPAPVAETGAAHRALADALDAKKDVAGAIAEFGKAFALESAAHLPEAALDLNSIGEELYGQSRYAEALGYFQKAMALTHGTGSKNEATALGDLGMTQGKLGRNEEGLATLRQSLVVFQKLGDRAWQANRLYDIGNMLQALGRMEDAAGAWTESGDVFHALPDSASEEGVAGNAASTLYDAKQYALAAKFYSRQLVCLNARGDKKNAATTLTNLGTCAENTHQYSQAADFYRQAVALRHAENDAAGEQEVVARLALALFDAARYAEATEAYSQLAVFQRGAGDKKGEALTLDNLGAASLRLRQNEKALDFYQQALALRRALTGSDRNADAEASSLEGIITANVALHQYDQALALYDDLRSLKPQGDADLEAALLDALADAHRSGRRSLGAKVQGVSPSVQAAQAAAVNTQGLADCAAKHYEKAILNFRRAMEIMPSEEAYTLNLARTLNETKRYAETVALIESALALFPDLGERKDLLVEWASAHFHLGKSQDAEKRWAAAGSHYLAAYDVDCIVQRKRASLELHRVAEDEAWQRRFVEAQQFFRRSAQISHEIADPQGEAISLSASGKMLTLQRQFGPALETLQEALLICRAQKMRGEEASILQELGECGNALSRFPEALEWQRQSLAAFRELGDRPSEATLLNSMGLTCTDMSQYPEAQNFFAQALTAWRAAHSIPGEARTLINIGSTFRMQGRYAESLASFRRALALRGPDGKALDRPEVSLNIGETLAQMGRYRDAVRLMQEALGIFRRNGDRSGEAACLDSLGQMFQSLGSYDEAMNSYRLALGVSRAAGNRKEEANALHQMGELYRTLCQFSKAADFFGQALIIRRDIGDREGEADTLNSQALVFDEYRLKDPSSYLKDPSSYDKAAALFEQALTLFRENGSAAGEAGALGNLGLLNLERHRPEEARKFFEMALAAHRRTGDREGECTVLNNIASLARQQNHPEEAIKYFEQSLALSVALGSKDLMQAAWSNMMETAKKMGNPAWAIYCGKQSVNLLQSLRGNLKSFDKGIQKNYLKMYAPAYRYLAEILIHQGRLSEAQQVLGMLKEEEFFDFLGRDPSAAKTLTASVTLTPFEADWQGRFQKATDRAASLADMARAFQVPASAAQSAAPLRKTLPVGTVAVYTIVEPDKLFLIVTTPAGQVARESPIAADDLYRKVLTFRNALQDPTRDPRPLAQDLYKIIVGPIAADLAKAHATMLLWSLDDALRYLPISALHDGKSYLVERYDNCILTLAGPSRTASVPAAWTGLGLGVSQQHPGFAALPGVRAELSGIIGPVVPGTALLDAKFTQASFLAGLKRRNHPLVHIASHFSLSGRDTDSFLLLGDGGHLSMAQMKADPNVFAGVDLLTLSACNTAMEVRSAGGKEVEGFGALAQRLGARSVLASLWPVADASTPVLMREFYRLRRANPQISKAAGLRQAQRELLRGQVTASSAPSKTNRAKRAKVAGAANLDLPLFVADPKAPYAHPYYWAPFVLIGNPQ